MATNPYTLARRAVLASDAGVRPHFVRVERLTPAQCNQIMRINVGGADVLTQALGRRWIERGSGSYGIRSLDPSETG